MTWNNNYFFDKKCKYWCPVWIVAGTVWKCCQNKNQNKYSSKVGIIENFGICAAIPGESTISPTFYDYYCLLFVWWWRTLCNFVWRSSSSWEYHCTRLARLSTRLGLFSTRHFSNPLLFGIKLGMSRLPFLVSIQLPKPPSVDTPTNKCSLLLSPLTFGSIFIAIIFIVISVLVYS